MELVYRDVKEREREREREYTYSYIYIYILIHGVVNYLGLWG